jgi:pantoate--beta-alanine ligase
MVFVVETTQNLIEIRQNEKASIAFVPTMGNLHQGHLSLLREALTKFKVVYFSIFVNPKQFGPKEDFNKYPRTLDDDLELIKSLDAEFTTKKIIVFAPKNPEEIYPPGFNHSISVLGAVSNILEGSIRPGHFDGVATVVHRLFELIKPQQAYFGLKDYQQFLVIKHMVKDLALPIVITGMPIIREDSGLALSSRNQYLSIEEKKEALTLSKTLLRIEKIINRKKENLSLAQEEIINILKDEKWNYLEIRDADTLNHDLSQSKQVTLLAVYQLRSTRLLDNLQVTIS